MKGCPKVTSKELASQSGSELCVNSCPEGEWKAGAGVEGLCMISQKSTSAAEQQDTY